MFALTAVAALGAALLLGKLDPAENGQRHHDNDERVSDDKSGFHFGSDVRQLSEWLSGATGAAYRVGRRKPLIFSTARRNCVKWALGCNGGNEPRGTEVSIQISMRRHK